MRVKKSLGIALSITCAFSIANTAHAWDPSAGAEATGAYNAAPTSLPGYVVPQRYYANPGVVTAPAAPATPAPTTTYYVPPGYAPPSPAPYPAPQPAPVANAIPVATAPVDTPPQVYTPPPAAAQNGVYQPPVYPPPSPSAYPAPAYAAPADMAVEQAPLADDSYPQPAHIASSLLDRTHFSLGGEGYYDQYKEPNIGVDNRGGFGSADGDFTYYFLPQWFATVDARASYGQVQYKSPSGKGNGLEDLEFENRITAGYDFDYGQNRHFKYYAGVGERYFNENGKGFSVYNQDLNERLYGYDRRIYQLYAPIGMTYEFPAWGLTFAPNAEFDPLIYGYVQSRLQSIPGNQEAHNIQHNGFGVRGELMMGQLDAHGVGWQFGPFIRYWNIKDSNIDQNASVPAGYGVVEPENNRSQTGVKLKILF